MPGTDAVPMNPIVYYFQHLRHGIHGYILFSVNAFVTGHCDDVNILNIPFVSCVVLLMLTKCNCMYLRAVESPLPYEIQKKIFFENGRCRQ